MHLKERDFVNVTESEDDDDSVAAATSKNVVMHRLVVNHDGICFGSCTSKNVHNSAVSHLLKRKIG